MAMYSIFPVHFWLFNLEPFVLTCEPVVLHFISSWFKAAMEI